LALADAFAAQVGCRIHDRAEVTDLPPDRLGPLATVYDSVPRAPAPLAGQAPVLAAAAHPRPTPPPSSAAPAHHPAPTQPPASPAPTGAPGPAGAVGTAGPGGAAAVAGLVGPAAEVAARFARSRLAMEGCRERLRTTR